MESTLEERIDTALREAERAALSMDAAAIARTAEALEVCVEGLLTDKLGPAVLQRIRQRVESYRDLCRFAGETLREALLAACQEDAKNAPTYHGTGQVSEASTHALIRSVG